MENHKLMCDEIIKRSRAYYIVHYPPAIQLFYYTVSNYYCQNKKNLLTLFTVDYIRREDEAIFTQA